MIRYGFKSPRRHYGMVHQACGGHVLRHLATRILSRGGILPFRLWLWSVPLITTLGGCASNATQPDLQHALIAQDGRNLIPVGAGGGTYQYVLRRAAFSVLVPNLNARGEARDARPPPISVCASADPAIFQGIAPGVGLDQTPCFNGFRAYARSVEDTPEGIDLLLSKGDAYNSIDRAYIVAGDSYNTVNVRMTVDFKVIGRTCSNKSGRCKDDREMVPYAGNTLYLIVLSDRNRNRVADLGEYTFLALRFTPP